MRSNINILYKLVYLFQSNQLLSTRGVNGNTAIKVGLGSSHLDGNTETLKHLTTANTHDVKTDDLLLGAGGNELVVGRALLVGLHHGVVHGSETGLVYLDAVLAILLDGLGLSQTNAADFGVGENDRGDVVVVELEGGEFRSAEQAMRQTTTSGDGDGGQFDLASDITEGEDVVDAGVLVFVGDDVALVVYLDAGLFQANVLGGGCATNSPDEVVDIGECGLVAAAVLVSDGELAIGILLDLGGLALLVQVDTEAFVFIGDGFLDDGVEAAEESVVTDEEMSLCAEGVEHAGEFDSNVTGADDGDLLGLLLDVEEAVRVDTELGARDRGRNARVTTDSDEDLLGVDEDLRSVIESHLGLVLGQQLTPAVKVLDLVVDEVSLVDSVESLDVGVALVLECRPVEGGRLLDREAVGLGLVDGLGNGGGVEGDLFGNATGSNC